MLNKIIYKIRQDGLKELFLSVKRFIHLTEFVYSIVLKEPLSIVIRNELEFQQMTLLDLELIKEKSGSELSNLKYKLLYERITSDSSEKPFVVKINKQIAGFYHIAFDGHFDSCVNMKVEGQKGNIHLFDDNTFKAYRGYGCHTYSIQERMKVGFISGCKTASVHIVKGNSFSERAYKKNRFVSIKKISVWFTKIKIVEVFGVEK